MLPSIRKYMIPLLLLVWFWIWGICPWNDASLAAQVLEASHTKQGHHGVDDTHHASKGTEHSCSGSISFTQNNLKTDQTLCLSFSKEHVPLSIDPAIILSRTLGFLRPIFERNTLPKLLTAFYQLYAVYRI